MPTTPKTSQPTGSGRLVAPPNKCPQCGATTCINPVRQFDGYDLLCGHCGKQWRSPLFTPEHWASANKHWDTFKDERRPTGLEALVPQPGNLTSAPIGHNVLSPSREIAATEQQHPVEAEEPQRLRPEKSAGRSSDPQLDYLRKLMKRVEKDRPGLKGHQFWSEVKKVGGTVPHAWKTKYAPCPTDLLACHNDKRNDKRMQRMMNELKSRTLD